MTDKPLIDEEMLNYVSKIAALKGCTHREALRGALATEYYLQSRIRDGWCVLLNKGKELRELIWR